MKKSRFIVFLIFIIIAAVLFPGCARAGSALNGSGKIIDQEINVAGFNSVNIRGVFEVEITRADSFKVIISTDDNLLGRVKVSLERKTLMLRIAAPATFFPTSLKVKITMPDIAGLSLSEKAVGVIAGFKLTDTFTIFMGEGSVMNGGLNGETVTINLSDASQLNMKGIATSLEMEVKGKSRADLGDFLLTTADVRLKEGSEATLNVSERFNLVLSEGSKIYYLGNPLFTNTSITGGSTMVQK